MKYWELININNENDIPSDFPVPTDNVGDEKKECLPIQAVEENAKKSSSNDKGDKGKFDTFQMKLYSDEKSRLEELAKAAGTDKTAFIKARIFSDENIVILDKSNFISRSLIEINDHLSAAMREDKLSDDLLENIYKKLCEVASAFVAVTKVLTIFKTSTQKEESL